MHVSTGEDVLLHLIAAHKFSKNALNFKMTTCNDMIYNLKEILGCWEIRKLHLVKYCMTV